MKTRYITHKGVTLSLKEWAARLKISVGSLHSRLSKGWPISRALSAPGREYDRKFTFNGETKTLTEWGRFFGVRRQLLAERLRRMPLDEAFSGARARVTECVEGLTDLLNEAAPEIEGIKAGLFSAKEQNKIDAIKARRARLSA
jgi:hypothetical protein